MLIDRVVVNASPLICLSKGGIEELFPALFKDVAVPEAVSKNVGSGFGHWRAQRRAAHSNGWKTRHGKSQSHVAWMAGGRGNASF